MQETVDRALALKPDARHGKALYKEHCASCHGNQAQGEAGNATPALAGQIVPYVIKQLADIAESHRQLPEMQRFTARPELSTPRTARDIATYVGSLSVVRAPGHGDGTQLALGERIYTYICADCHGQRGEGSHDNRGPALRGQHYSYLLMESKRLAAGHRYSVDVAVILLLEGLSMDQLSAVADFASRLPPAREGESLAGAGDAFR